MRSTSSFTHSTTHSATTCAPANARAGQGLVADQPEGKLIKIGAKIISHGRNVTFQVAELAFPKHLFAETLRLIAEQRPPADPEMV